MRLRFNTTNTYLSPVVDTQRVSTILTSNRVNSVITNYATDNRTGSIFNDPTAFQYVSKEITLETPATSVKVILNAYVNSYCDIRAFYSIGENPDILKHYERTSFRTKRPTHSNSFRVYHGPQSPPYPPKEHNLNRCIFW